MLVFVPKDYPESPLRVIWNITKAGVYGGTQLVWFRQGKRFGFGVTFRYLKRRYSNVYQVRRGKLIWYIKEGQVSEADTT